MSNKHQKCITNVCRKCKLILLVYFCNTFAIFVDTFGILLAYFSHLFGILLAYFWHTLRAAPNMLLAYFTATYWNRFFLTLISYKNTHHVEDSAILGDIWFNWINWVNWFNWCNCSIGSIGSTGSIGPIGSIGCVYIYIYIYIYIHAV